MSVHAAAFALRNGQIARALALANSILENDPEHLGALEVQAQALWKSKDYRGALGVANRLIGIYPYERGYFEFRAGCLEAMGHLAKASAAVHADETHNIEPSPSLLDWNIRLVKQLLVDDSNFRRIYKRDPEEACKGIGIPFSPELLLPCESRAS